MKIIHGEQSKSSLIEFENGTNGEVIQIRRKKNDSSFKVNEVVAVLLSVCIVGLYYGSGLLLYCLIIKQLTK
jgi:hypothetical protein